MRPAGLGRGEGYLFDIEVVASARGRGLGRAAVLAAEQAARERGADVLRLNVFAHNAPARRVYDGLGYGVRRQVWTLRHPVGAAPSDPGTELHRPAQVSPGHDRWVVRADGAVIGGFCRHVEHDPAGPGWEAAQTPVQPVQVHDVTAPRHRAGAVLAALVRQAADLRAAVLTVTVDVGNGLPAACETAGLALAAELREKRLAPGR